MPIPVQPEKIEKTTAKDRVFTTLQSWIIYGTLLPGERLNDNELAAFFSVSRTPVREAIQLLAEQKLVVIIPSSGTFVSEIDIENMTAAYNLLGELQSLAAQSLKGRFSSADAEKLTGLNETFLLNAKYNDPSDAMEADGSFHHYIAECTGNPYIVKYTDELIIQAHRNEFQFFKNGYHTDESYDTHKKIIEALSSDDMKAAALLLKENWKISISV